MRFTFASLAAGLVLASLAACSSSPKTADETAQARAEVRTVTSETLNSLYSFQPSAKQAVESASGYAVFSNFGMKILVAGGGSGKGIAHNNKSKADTFMRMAEIQAGLGMGVKKFRLVWVFTTPEAFANFVDKGWEFGGQASATAQYKDQGGGMTGAVPIAPGVYLYQLSDDGLSLELTVKGTKYYKDSSLN